MSAIKCS